MKQWLARRRQGARAMKIEAFTVFLACRDRRLPLITRILAICVVAYAFSPLDLIPDFIPVLGYLDDLILVPLGIALVLRLIPPALLDEYRDTARELATKDKPANWIAAAFIIALWVTTMAFLLRYFLW